MNVIGISLEERDGRVYHGTEDWGKVVYEGDPLPCGCKIEMRGKPKPKICAHPCHDMHRLMHLIP